MRRAISLYKWMLVSILWAVAMGCVSASPLPISGLHPVTPKTSIESHYVKIHSLLPRFQWEPLQELIKRESNDNTLLKRIDHITYDLTIWSANQNMPDKVVYLRSGLTEPSHRLEQPLEPATNYFWTVRARFMLDGHPRMTQWGTIYSENTYGIKPEEWPHTAYRIPNVPNPFYFRIRTH